jgi:hypothetical protein
LVLHYSVLTVLYPPPLPSSLPMASSHHCRAASMNYIYEDGDIPGVTKWFTPSSYAAMVLLGWKVLRSSGKM